MMLHAHSQGPLRQYDHCCIVILSSYVTLLLLAFRQLWKDYGGPCVAGQLHAHLQCYHRRAGCAESASIMRCRCGQEHEPVWFASGDAQQLWVGQPRPQWGGNHPQTHFLLTLSGLVNCVTERRKEKDKNVPFGGNLMKSQILYRAAMHLCAYHRSVAHQVSETCRSCMSVHMTLCVTVYVCLVQIQTSRAAALAGSHCDLQKG